MIDRLLLQTALAALTPPEQSRPSEWVAKHIVMPSLSFVPGPLQLDSLQSAIVDTLFEYGTREVVLCGSAQLGKSVILLSALMYALENENYEAALMLVRSDDADAINWIREIFDPVRIASGFKNGAGTTSALRHKSTATAHLSVVGSYNPAALSSRTLKFAACDEPDRWCPSTSQGRPLDLIRARLKLHADSKLILTSSPTSPDGTIYTEALRGDQQRWMIRCPGCARQFELTFDHIVADDDPDKSFARCDACGHIIDERTRVKLTARGEWVATNPHGEKGVRSYFASELQSRFSSIARVVREHRRSLTSPDAAVAFQNLVLGKPATRGAWGIDPSTLAQRAEPIPATGGYYPSAIVAVTQFADIQQDRIETLSVGWESAGADGPMWLLSHKVLIGSTFDDAVWQALMAEYARASYRTQDGRALKPALLGIDCGFLPDRVADCIVALRRAGLRAEGVAGRSGWDQPAIRFQTQQSRANRGQHVKFWRSGVDPLKLQFLDRLQISDPKSPRFVHIPFGLTPQGNNGDGSFIDGLTSEKLITTYSKRGIKVQSFEKTRDRNEGLDLAVGNLAIVNLVDVSQIAKPGPQPSSADLAAKVRRLNGLPAQTIN